MSLSDVPEFDEAGVTLTKDAHGKFSTFLTFLKNGVIVYKLTLTYNRAQASAFREGLNGLDALALGLSRKKYVFGERHE